MPRVNPSPFLYDTLYRIPTTMEVQNLRYAVAVNAFFIQGSISSSINDITYD